jgi:hypothetical protein
VHLPPWRTLEWPAERWQTGPDRWLPLTLEFRPHLPSEEEADPAEMEEVFLSDLVACGQRKESFIQLAHSKAASRDGKRHLGRVGGTGKHGTPPRLQASETPAGGVLPTVA